MMDLPELFQTLAQAQPMVCAEAGFVSMRFNPGELQSLMSVQHPNQLELHYTKTMMGFLLMAPHPRHILMIGLGGGSLVKFCYHHLPDTRITVVEINPHVIAQRGRFRVPDDDERLAVVCADGADFVRDTGQDFDVILVDGFDVQGQSAQLSSRAFYGDCCRALRPQGVMVVNMDSDHPAHAAFLQRLGSCYQDNVVEVRIQDRGNHVVFAVKDMAITASAMNAGRALGRLAVEAQAQLKDEFQRILQLLDALEQARVGAGLYSRLTSET